MADDDPGTPPPPDSSNPGADRLPDASAPFTQPLSHSPVSARVPERVGRGIFATGVIAQEGPTEFVLDFVQSLTRPPQIAARVVLPPPVMHALIASLGENLGKYAQAFGPPPPLPRPPQPAKRPTTQELYENFKLGDDLLSGAYANSVLIGHDPAEFFLDFITRFYPNAAVSCRVYLAAAQAPRVLETLTASFQQFQRRMAGQPPRPPEG